MSAAGPVASHLVGAHLRTPAGLRVGMSPGEGPLLAGRGLEPTGSLLRACLQAVNPVPSVTWSSCPCDGSLSSQVMFLHCVARKRAARPGSLRSPRKTQQLSLTPQVTFVFPYDVQS